MRSLFVVLIISLFFVGCEKSKESSFLKVGISPWPGYEPFVLAAKKSYFSEAHIRLVRFATPTESYRALRDGVIDIAAFTVDEVFHYAEVRDKPKIFLVLDISNGGDAIVVRPEIKKAEDLKGKTMGVEGSALGDYMMHRFYDHSHNLKPSDLKFKHIPINHQEAAYRAGDVDALVTYEPSKSLLLAAGAHVLFDSKQIPNEIIDVLVANNKTITSRNHDIKILVKGWFKALDYIKSHKEESIQIMAKNGLITDEQFRKGFEELIIPSLEDNFKMLKDNGTLLVPMQRLAQMMFDRGDLYKKIDIKPLLDDRIIKAIKD